MSEFMGKCQNLCLLSQQSSLSIIQQICSETTAINPDFPNKRLPRGSADCSATFVARVAMELLSLLSAFSLANLPDGGEVSDFAAECAGPSVTCRWADVDSAALEDAFLSVAGVPFFRETDGGGGGVVYKVGGARSDLIKLPTHSSG